MTTGAALHELDLIRTLARTFKQAHPGVSLVVIGATLDDLGLMACGNVFVSGAIEERGYASAFRRYGWTAISSNARRSVRSCRSRRRAGIQPSAGLFRLVARPGTAARHDLPIDPALCNEDVAMALGRWMARSRERRGR